MRLYGCFFFAFSVREHRIFGREYVHGAVENFKIHLCRFAAAFSVKRPYLGLFKCELYFGSFYLYKRVAVEVAFHYSVEHVERRKRIRELAHEQKLKLTVVKLDIIFVKFEKSRNRSGI